MKSPVISYHNKTIFRKLYLVKRFFAGLLDFFILIYYYYLSSEFVKSQSPQPYCGKSGSPSRLRKQHCPPHSKEQCALKVIVASITSNKLPPARPFPFLVTGPGRVEPPQSLSPSPVSRQIDSALNHRQLIDHRLVIIH